MWGTVLKCDVSSLQVLCGRPAHNECVILGHLVFLPSEFNLNPVDLGPGEEKKEKKMPTLSGVIGRPVASRRCSHLRAGTALRGGGASERREQVYGGWYAYIVS